jgi:F-type H+-transporting ATPase subunit b
VLIDWFTVVAQIVNFLILVFLLQRFLYGPIVKAMDERERRIVDRLHEAERKELLAADEIALFERKQAELEAARGQMLAEAEQEAAVLRKDLLRQARAEVDEVQRQWHDALEMEKQNFLRDLRQRTTHQVYQVARRALADLADSELQGQMVRVFLRRLQSIDADARREVRQSARGELAPITIYSGFELQESDRSAIVDALREVAGNDLAVEFEVSPHLVSGIELRSASRRVAWNLDHYLNDLEDRITKMIERETYREHEPESELAEPVATQPVSGG